MLCSVYEVRPLLVCCCVRCGLSWLMLFRVTVVPPLSKWLLGYDCGCHPPFLLWGVFSCVQTVTFLFGYWLSCVKVFVHIKSVWGFECLTYCLCEGLIVGSVCGPIPLVARKFLHLLARYPTYMVDLWARLYLSIIIIGYASLVVDVTYSELRFQKKASYLLITFRSVLCFDFSTIWSI